MAGNLEDSSKWRLKTSTGIPFKVKSMDGELDREGAGISVTVLIEARSLLDFAAFLMPEPIRIGNLEFPTSTSLGGIPQIIARSIRFRSFDDGFPIDPFSSDFGAPVDTYFPVIEVDINYESGQNQDDDPFTFLEISGNATGEFLHTTAPSSKWRPVKNTKVDKADEDPGMGIDPETNEPDPAGVRVDDGDKEVNRNPMHPVTISIPMTEWTLRWPQLRQDLFRSIIIHRLRILMGRVNSVAFPLLFNAAPETLLFMGWSYQQKSTWRDGFINNPPISLELKMVEKRVMWDGVIRGHNDFWRPGKGWEELLIDGTQNVYRSWDFNNLFKI